MEPQVVELVEQPINQAYVRSRRQHRSVLVTTGSIHEEVGRRLTGRNTRWKRDFLPLETWKGSELLAAFLKHTGRFLPAPVPEFHRLLGFMIADGHGLLDKPEFDRLLRSILPTEASPGTKAKSEAVKAIPVAAVIVEYALAGFDRAGNHFARIEAYTMLLCYVLALAARFSLPERSWGPTSENLERGIDHYAGLLASEAMKADAGGQGNPLTEPIIAPYRAALLAGALSAHGFWHALGGRSAWYDDKASRVGAAIKALVRKAQLPSEAFVPAIFLASQHLRHNGDIATGENLLCRLLLESVYRKQAQPNVRPMWGVYLKREEAMLRDLGRPIDPHDKEAWEHRSHTAWSLILIAARRLRRQDLERLWYPITSMHFIETVPDQAWRQVLWHIDKGTSQEHMVPQPTKWPALHGEASRNNRLPRVFSGRMHFLPYFLLVYPHRFTPKLVLSLDDALSGQRP